MSSRQHSNEAAKRAQILQDLVAKREKQQLKQQEQLQKHAVASNEEAELLNDFSSPEKPLKPQQPEQKGLSRLKPASAAPSVDSLTSSLTRMQLSEGARHQQQQPADIGTAALASRLLPPSASASSSEAEESEEQEADAVEGSSDEGDTGNRKHPPVHRPQLLGKPGGLQAHKGPNLSSSFSGPAASGGACFSPPAPSQDDLVLGEQQQYRLHAALYKSLYAHQVEGVKWLWSLFAVGKGGILGDDMGLGKTMQCAAFLTGLLNSRLSKRAMIVAPKTLLMHWHKELEACGLGRCVHAFYGDSASERAASLNAATGKAGGVLLTTYGMCLHNADALAQPACPASSLFVHKSSGQAEENSFKWDLVILDEGHKVKNPKMKLVAQLLKIPSHIRVIISGTPIQNNLTELRNLMDFCCEDLLGNSRTFSRLYGKPITDGQDRNATAREREVGAAIAHELRRKIAPYFLRREKKDVLTCSSSTEPSKSPETADTQPVADQQQGAQQQAVPKGLSRKNDLVVWLRLKPLQRAVYEAFLHSEAVRRALNETESPLAALTVLKKTCDHPALLSESAAESVLLGGNRWAKGKGVSSDDSSSEESEEELSSDQDSEGGGYTGKGRRVAGSRCNAKGKRGGAAASLPEALLSQFDGSIEKQLLTEMESKAAEASCKSQFVLSLLDELAGKGHRTLVFSQSRVMLDILQAGVQARGMTHCRIDGSIASAEDRQAQVRRFQDPKSNIPVFLLTSQVGGLGLTLTAADRVVIVDPSWNPAVDNQAVDRAYRIGQARDVVVYRLITCGTVEEKIYSRQVFKGGLSRAGTEEGTQFRYFSQQQLRDLFTVTPEGLERSSTQQHLHRLHAGQRTASAELQTHLKFLEGIACYAGISDHDLLFSCKPEDPALSDPGSIAADYISRMKMGSNGGRGGGSSSSRGTGVELQDMFGAAMRANSSAGPVLGQQLQINAQKRKVQDLQARLDSTQRTLSTMSSMLPDGGSKLLAKQAEALQELSEARAKLLSMMGQQGAEGSHQLPEQLDQVKAQVCAEQPGQPQSQQQQRQRQQQPQVQQQQKEQLQQAKLRAEQQARAEQRKQLLQQQQQQALMRAQQQKQQACVLQQQKLQDRRPLGPLPYNNQQQVKQSATSVMEAQHHQHHKPSPPYAVGPGASRASSSSGGSSFVTAGSVSSDSPGGGEVSSSFPSQRQQQPRPVVPFVDLT